jgi:hypothetical protein
VPHFWIQVPGNPKPPKKMRDDAGQVIHKHGGRLLDDLLYFKPSQPNLGYGTVECGMQEIAKIASELKAEYERVLTADEMDVRVRRRRRGRRG